MASFNIFNPIPLIIALFFSSQFSITKALHIHGKDLDKDNTKDLNRVRIEWMLIIFATTFPCALLPYFFRKNAKFLLLGTQFAGGVFLATSMHFLSDSIEGKTDLSDILFSLTLLGYFLTAFGEIILFKMLKKKKTSGEPRAVVEVEEGRNAAAAAVEVVEEESVAAVGVAVLTLFGLAIHSFDEGFQIGKQSK